MRCYYISYDNQFLSILLSHGLKNAQISNNRMSHFQRTPDPERQTCTQTFSKIAWKSVLTPPYWAMPWSSTACSFACCSNEHALMLMNKCPWWFLAAGDQHPFRSQVSCFQVSLAGISELGAGALHQTRASFLPQKLTMENSLWLKQQQQQK